MKKKKHQMKKKMTTRFATTAIATGLLAFSSVSSASFASGASSTLYDFTNTDYQALNGQNMGTVNGLTFKANPGTTPTLTFNANTGHDPDRTKAPCGTLACDGDGIGIDYMGDTDEISGKGTSDARREALTISGFGGQTINAIAFLDLFYEQQTTNGTDYFKEIASFKFFDGSGMQIGGRKDVSARWPRDPNGFAVWKSKEGVSGVDKISFFVRCKPFTEAGIACTDVDFSVAAVSAVPVPAAVWLFGSGLIGLVGIARRRKAIA